MILTATIYSFSDVGFSANSFRMLSSPCKALSGPCLVGVHSLHQMCPLQAPNLLPVRHPLLYTHIMPGPTHCQLCKGGNPVTFGTDYSLTTTWDWLSQTVYFQSNKRFNQPTWSIHLDLGEEKYLLLRAHHRRQWQSPVLELAPPTSRIPE